MSMQYIRDYYNVPAKRGARVSYTSPSSLSSKEATTREGTITSAQGARLMILFDGMKRSMPYHPIWGLTYLEDGGKS